MTDMVNAPQHYRGHASGVECIDITEHMSFNAGNAMKYVYRRNDKWNTLEDIKKARWYMHRHATYKAAPTWVHRRHEGCVNLETVIDHEEPGNVYDFYTALLHNDERSALAALDREIARLEAIAS